ncbi:peptidoglycan recognition protein family protein [Camelimonas lactis]|uniref:N-acetylmuramoyl-L-alanine amidase n=1 Tax=Camelimonas lactis TaxID=659006 RepID=A0A4R2GU22_9HYPH|nr:peptidoglycan-binding protein [Camelimonas lactis]TCO12425.1 N-acetylmuramoyl-L-alanine amidase [Camelimonas lactis]
MTNREIQQALATLGYYKGAIDGVIGPISREAIRAYQYATGITVDGIAGPVTQSLLRREIEARAPRPADDDLRPPVFRELKSEWLPDAVMKGVIVHWTAGTNSFSDADNEHYHFAIDGESKVHRCRHAISANDARGRAPDYAAHTLNCNTGWIGVALCGMRQAVEQPFNAGPSPIRLVQWTALGVVVAELCHRYSIAVTPRTVLSHAEVQPTLGIQQRGKWDISRLPWDPSVRSARAVGDLLRADVAVHLNNLRSA